MREEAAFYRQHLTYININSSANAPAKVSVLSSETLLSLNEIRRDKAAPTISPVSEPFKDNYSIALRYHKPIRTAN